MAITYEKGKGITKRTGFDKAQHKFGSAIEKIKSGARKAATAIPRARERKAVGDAQKEIKDIERAFGTMDKYVEFNPSFAPRAKKLREKAGF